MKKKLLFLVGFFFALVVVFVLLKIFIFDRTTNNSALRVDCIPKAEVFVNDQSVGQTPYFAEKMKPGDYKIKLVVPNSYWESKVKLTDGGLTYISRNLTESIDLQSGQILWLSKLLNDKSAELTVVSDPDSGNVTIDGLDKGKTSITLSDLELGDHEIVVSKQGFGDQVINGKLIGGWRLNVVVKLGKINSPPEALLTPTPTASPSAIPSMSKPYVVIKNTPVGFLRVRSEPDANSTESGRVKPDEKYSILSEVSGWVKIRSATSSAILGWVSDKYVEKVK